MKRSFAISTIILSMSVCVAAGAQTPFATSTPYTPQSNTALSITGTVRFSEKAIGINGKTYPLTLTHTLTATELQDSTTLFSIDTATSGYLFKVSIPGNAPMLNHNTLCSGACTWVLAVYTAPDQLNLAFFTGDASPGLAHGALMQSSNVSGTYWYAKVPAQKIH